MIMCSLLMMSFHRLNSSQPAVSVGYLAELKIMSILLMMSFDRVNSSQIAVGVDLPRSRRLLLQLCFRLPVSMCVSICMNLSIIDEFRLELSACTIDIAMHPAKFAPN